MKSEKAYQQAQKKAKDKVGFYYHLFVFVAVIALLTVINLTTNAEYFWVKWPLMGWGIGLLFHGLNTFIFSENSSFTQRMIDKEMRNQRMEEDEMV